MNWLRFSALMLMLPLQAMALECNKPDATLADIVFEGKLLETKRLSPWYHWGMPPSYIALFAVTKPIKTPDKDKYNDRIIIHYLADKTLGSHLDTGQHYRIFARKSSQVSKYPSIGICDYERVEAER